MRTPSLNFLETLINTPSPSGHEARRTIELLAAIYKSAFTGEIVRAGSIVPGDPFYAAVHGGGRTRARAS